MSRISGSSSTTRRGCSAGVVTPRLNRFDLPGDAGFVSPVLQRARVSFQGYAYRYILPSADSNGKEMSFPYTDAFSVAPRTSLGTPADAGAWLAHFRVQTEIWAERGPSPLPAGQSSRA